MPDVMPLLSLPYAQMAKYPPLISMSCPQVPLSPLILTTLKSPPISSFQRASRQDCWLTPSPPMRTAVPRSLRHMAWHHRGLGLPEEGRAQTCEQSDKTPSAPFPVGRTSHLNAQRGEMVRQGPLVASLCRGKRHTSRSNIFSWLQGITAVLRPQEQGVAGCRMHSGCHFRQAWMSPIYYPISRSDIQSCAPCPALLLVREDYPGTACQCLG